MRSLLSIITCILFFAGTALCSDTEEVQALLKMKVDAVVELLQNAAMEKTVRNTRILDIINPIFDFDTMAKLSLGKKYWPTLNEAQQAEFSDLFIRRLQESYLDKLDIYTDEKVVYGEPLTQASRIHIPTILILKDNSIEMLYKFYPKGAEWKIYDVEIGGVSVIQTYRSQFDGVLQNGSFDDLLKKLQAEGVFVLPAPGGEGSLQGNE